jgi:hypothetical protein
MSFWQTLRNICLVTALTALVWVFAEAESIRARTVRFDLVFETEPTSTRFIHVNDASAFPGRVTVAMEGPVAALDAVERVARSTLKFAPTAEGIPADPGEHTVDIKTLLRSHPQLRALGATIESVDPPSVRVEVDNLKIKELPIRVETAGLELAGTPDVLPNVAQITLPERALARLKPDAAASVALDSATATKLVPGQRTTIPGVAVRPPVDLAGVPGLRIEPAAASVTLSVRNRTSSIVLPRVPVDVRLPASDINRWTVTIPEEDRALTDVRIVGPVELVERIQRGELVVVATLSLSPSDLEQAITSKAVEFLGLPDSLRFDVQNATIRVQIERRP